MPTIEDRLARRSMMTACGCRIWFGSTDPKGYGRIHNPHGSRHTHIVAYELVKGPVPKGKELDHLCRVPSCINPDHLEPVTRQENILRGILPSTNKARYAARTHCKLGHELTDENTYIFNHPDGIKRRRCKLCNALEQRELRKRRIKFL